MKRQLIYLILWMVFECSKINAQVIVNLTTVDKSDYFFALTYKAKGDCYQANLLLNSFIAVYKGEDQTYWIEKAKKHLMPCTDTISIANTIDYEYRYQFKNRKKRTIAPFVNTSHADQVNDHSEEHILPNDPKYIDDITRHIFDTIRAYQPQVLITLKPLIENIQTQDSVIATHNHSEHSDEHILPNDPKYIEDVSRHIFDTIRAYQPQVLITLKPLIEQTLSNPTQVTNNITSTTSTKPVPDITKQSKPNEARAEQNKAQEEIVNNPMTEEPEIKTIVNNPMTEEPDTKNIVNNPMTEEPNKKAIVNNPMTEEPEINTIVNNPMTEEPDRKSIVNTEITVTEKKHHYKILFTIESQPDKTFMSMANIGPVTYEKANGENYIYYIGFFQSEEKAIDAREKVKASGYKMARVMEFNKGALEKEFKEEKEQPTIAEVLDKKTITETKPVEIPKTPKAEEPKQPEKPKEQIQEVIKSDVVSYHILFRVLDNPYEKFDNLKQFGPLYRETFDAKGSSRYLIGITDDINIAKQLLEKVKKAGYGASMVAEYVNGQLSKIVTE